MLNMLIAIMGNTFDMVMEKRAIYVMKSQLQTVSEYSGVIKKFERDSHSYLFIVKQLVEDEAAEDDDNWEGGFTSLKKSMTKKMDQVKEEMNTLQIQ